MENIHDSRRIFTDGRDWPKEMSDRCSAIPSANGSIPTATARYDLLEVETRGFVGPRAYDASGIPLHDDNQSVVKERIHVDRTDPNLLIDEVTVIDHALTRPWSVVKGFRRVVKNQPVWIENVCGEFNGHVQIGNEGYMVSGDGPADADQKGTAAAGPEIFSRHEVAHRELPLRPPRLARRHAPGCRCRSDRIAELIRSWPNCYFRVVSK